MNKILIAVTGGIAAYKACDLVSRLKKNGDDVKVIMTQHASEFVSPITFEALSGHHVYLDTFERSPDASIHHIDLAKWADIFVVVPATANTIAKIANGIADDLISSTILAATCKKIICPAMNTNMYLNKATQRNLETLKDDNMIIVSPAKGRLACGDTGVGKLADIDDIFEIILQHAVKRKPLEGKKVIVTAGPTIEPIDPVRYITNHSSGKMGYAIAKQAKMMGADVILLTGPTHLKPPYGIEVIPFTNACMLLDIMKEKMHHADYIIMSAAIGDYRSEEIAEQKIKKQGNHLILNLVKNPDILQYLGEHKTNHQIICGFAMETENLIENATLKLNKKKCHMIVANHLREKGAGFKTDTNVATFITHEGLKKMDLMSKEELSKEILKELIHIKEEKEGC